MASVSIKQFDGNDYTSLLPYSVASLYRAEGNIERISSQTTDEDFILAIDEAFEKMPVRSIKMIQWQDYPAISGTDFSGFLCKANNNTGSLIGWNYYETGYYRSKLNGVWASFQEMPIINSKVTYFYVSKYVGTGAYGETARNSIGGLKRVPKLVLIQQNNIFYSDGSGALLWTGWETGVNINCIARPNSFTWYSTKSASMQHNSLGQTYYCFILC